MATKKQTAARAKFARQARTKGNTKVGRRAKSTAKPRKKGAKSAGYAAKPAKGATAAKVSRY